MYNGIMRKATSVRKSPSLNSEILDTVNVEDQVSIFGKLDNGSGVVFGEIGKNAYIIIKYNDDVFWEELPEPTASAKDLITGENSMAFTLTNNLVQEDPPASDETEEETGNRARRRRGRWL